MTLTSNSERFLTAFSSIEADMNRRVKSDRYISYAELVRRVSNLDKGYHKFQRYLEEFGDLRNAIVHERIDGEVIAEPHLKIVLEIEQIASVLTQPERVKDHFLKKVDVVSEETLLSKAALLLENSGYSKVPVYDLNHRFKGLLTTDAITHYLTKQLSAPGFDFTQVKVSDVLSTDTKDRHVSFVSETATLVSVISEFERALSLGKRLQEVIITQDGALNQKPLGIITVADLTSIYEKINRNLII
jgi:predicted transcriptional regulator